MRSDCTEHEQMHGRDVWMPRRCQIGYYTFGALRDQVFGSPLYAAQYRVRAFDFKPWPDDRFELKYTTPGARVNDGTFPEVEGKSGVLYTMPANPQQLDEVIATARATYQARANAESRSYHLKVLFLVVNGVLVVGLLISFVVRRRKARSA
jgi:hypothetical protein